MTKYGGISKFIGGSSPTLPTTIQTRVIAVKTAKAVLQAQYQLKMFSIFKAPMAPSVAAERIIITTANTVVGECRHLIMAARLSVIEFKLYLDRFEMIVNMIKDKMHSRI